MLFVSDLISKSTVKIGSTFFPLNTVENILKSTCKQVMVHTNYPEYPYQLLGSITCIKINSRYFGICTGHQIGEDQFKDTSIFIFEKNVTVSPNNIYTFTCDEPDLSLIFFEFSDAVNEFEFISNNFFKANISEIWPIKERNHFIIFGFPSKFQEILEIYETKTALISAKYHKKSNVPYAHIVEIKGNMKINSDGMSGGPVYYIGGYPGDYFIGWAGMIVRGGNPSEKLYFIEAGFIFERLLELTAQKNPKA